VRIVVNRWSKQIDLDLQQVEKFLGEPVVSFIPSDYQTAVTSINLGQPLILSDSDSKIAQEIRRLARMIAGGNVAVVEPKPRRAFWSSLLGRAQQPQFDLQTTMGMV
jgi:Flp pilus assembly CpaE family ATPase